MPRDPSKHPLDDLVRVQHMLEAARDARQLGAGKVIADLQAEMPLRRAVVNAIQDIGEAASKVSPQGRSRFPNLPWAAIVGTRNRLVHAYDQINLEVLWKVLTDELDPLIAELERGLANWPTAQSKTD